MIPYIIVIITTVILSIWVRPCSIFSGDFGKGYLGNPFPQRKRILNILLLMCIFLILFGLSALRYKVGNDYPRYEEFFHLIPLKQVVPTEAGFNISVLILQWIFGGEAPLPIFTVYALVTVLFMLFAIYEQSRDFAFSFFLFMCFSYYFQSLNTVRYYLAWAVALYSVKFVLRKEWLKFILLILAVSTIHKSVLLVIPVYIIARFSLKLQHYIVITALGVLVFIFRSQALKLIVRFYSSYEGTQYLGGGTSIINIIRIAVVFIVSLILYKKAVAGDVQYEFCFRLNFFALILYTCGSFIPEISRIGYYFSAGHIFLIPGLVASIENEKLKKAAIICTMMGAILYFAVFLYLAQDLLVRIVPYHSWVLPGDIR